MGQTGKRLPLLPLSIVGLALLAGCVDEKIVYQDRELFEEPLTEAMSFLGYTDHETKLTVCGNCHVEKQGQWEETGHADAWEGLQASGAAQTFCEGCHTVGQNGNLIAEIAGYEATAEERYEDVQCESCHGPGLAHVENPTDATVPLAALNVGADAATGCGDCHSDTHHPFLEEWAQSRHGDASTHKNYREREGCDSCHGGEGALRAWGVNTDYIEKGQGDQIGITCAVCHDPHDPTNENQLRWPVDSRNVDENLCMKCHQKRAVPEASNSRGPHSPQGPLLLGQDVGWIPPNFVYQDQLIRGTHGSEANENLCATCHVNSFTVTDPASGDHVFSATGHLFKAIPCLDPATGIPTGDDSCGMNTTERTFVSCTTSGCHGSADAALSALLISQARIAALVAELDALLDLVPSTEFNSSDGVLTVAEGANFNAGLGDIESSAVHNPFLTEALLTGSIDAMMTQYGLPLLSPDLDLNPIMWELSTGGN